MARYEKFLYDDIGNSYERKNQYILDLIKLEEPLDQGSGFNKAEIKRSVRRFIKNKDKHDYMIALNKFLKAEKEFLKSLKEIYKKEKEQLKNKESKYILKLKLMLVVESKNLQFYKNYVDISYEAQLKYEAAKIRIPQLENQIDGIHSRQEALKKAYENLRLAKETEQKELLESFKNFKKDQYNIYKEKVKKLNQKKKDGLVSKKAFKNGKIEFKKAYKEAITVKSYDLPLKAAKEMVKTLRYQLKSDFKRDLAVLESNVADLRRKTPVEVFSTKPVRSRSTFLLPGLGQIFNGQKKKGLFFLFLSFFVYVVAIPYALGFGNYQGQGVAGLVSLAEGGLKLHRSLFFMIEGIIAIFLVLFALAILLASFMDVRKVEKSAIKGIRPRNWFETKTNLSEEGFPYMVSLPALIAVVFIILVPITTAILLSFTNMDPGHQNKFNWIGLENYKMIALGEGIAGGAFWNILGWTVVWTLVATSLAIFIGFFLAIISNNERIKGKTFFRAVYLLPWAVPAFITIMFFSIMFSNRGILTDVINNVFNPSTRLVVKNSAFWSRVTLIGIQGWLGSAYVFLLSTGVLQAIPADLYEAAQIDGATSWQKLKRITLPIVLFQTAPLLVGQYTFNFNNFSIIYLFNGGGPFNPTKYGNLAGSTDLLISYIFKLTTENSYQAIGAAITVVIALGLMLFAFIGFKNSKAFKEEKL